MLGGSTGDTPARAAHAIDWLDGTIMVNGEEKKIEVTATDVDTTVPSMSYTFAEV